MNTIAVEQIQLDPAAFVHRIEAGEALVVLRDNRPVAEVKPVLGLSSSTVPDRRRDSPQVLLMSMVAAIDGSRDALCHNR